MDVLSDERAKLDFHMNDLRNIMKLPNILKAFIDKIERQDIHIARLQAELTTKATASSLEQSRIEARSEMSELRDELRKESQRLQEDIDTKATKGELEVAVSELRDAMAAHAHDVDAEVQRLDGAIQDNSAAIDRLEEEVSSRPTMQHLKKQDEKREEVKGEMIELVKKLRSSVDGQFEEEDERMKKLQKELNRMEGVVSTKASVDDVNILQSRMTSEFDAITTEMSILGAQGKDARSRRDAILTRVNELEDELKQQQGAMVAAMDKQKETDDEIRTTMDTLASKKDVAAIHAEVKTKASKGEVSSGFIEAKKQASTTARVVKDEVTKMNQAVEAIEKSFDELKSSMDPRLTVLERIQEKQKEMVKALDENVQEKADKAQVEAVEKKISERPTAAQVAESMQVVVRDYTKLESLDEINKVVTDTSVRIDRDHNHLLLLTAQLRDLHSLLRRTEEEHEVDAKKYAMSASKVYYRCLCCDSVILYKDGKPDGTHNPLVLSADSIDPSKKAAPTMVWWQYHLFFCLSSCACLGKGTLKRVGNETDTVIACLDGG